MSRHADESAADYLRRVVSSINYENDGRLDDLKTTKAVIEFFELWAHYNTDLWEGVLECISEGDRPGPALRFIKRHKLPRSWRNEVAYAFEISKDRGAVR